MSAARKRPVSGHCHIIPAHWSQYLEGEFSTAECRRCETHLKTCPACRAELKGVRHAVGACRAARQGAVPAPLNVQARQRAKALLRRLQP